MKEIGQDVQAAPNWLSEITGQSRAGQYRSIAVPQPASSLAESLADDPLAADNQPQEVQAAGPNALAIAGRGLAVLARNPVTFLALLAAVVLTEQVVGFFPVSVGVPVWMLLPVLTTVACMALYAGAFHTALSSLKGEKVNLDTSLRAIVSTPKSAYGAIALTVSSLSFLLLIPAIGVAWRWALVAPVAIVEGGDARARSAALATPWRAQVRLLVWLLAGLSILRGLLMLPLSPERMLTVLTGDWLFPMLLTLVTAVTSAVLYHELVSLGAEVSPDASSGAPHEAPGS